MQLSELTGEANDEMTVVSLAEAVEVTGLTADSRKVGPGYLFAALPGAQSDGRDFIDEAVSKGAVVVLAPKGTALKAYEPPVALVEDDNPNKDTILAMIQDLLATAAGPAAGPQVFILPRGAVNLSENPCTSSPSPLCNNSPWRGTLHGRRACACSRRRARSRVWPVMR